MEKRGYQILVTILLPGTLLLAAASLGVGNLVRGSHAFQMIEQFLTREWIACGSLLLAASLLGTLLGSVLDSVETHTYDRWDARDMKLTDSAYWEEWLKYVDSLSDKTNPFVDQRALYFFFESRTAAASLILGVPWSLVSWSYGELGIAMALVGGILFAASPETHLILSDYRHRNCAAKA